MEAFAKEFGRLVRHARDDKDLKQDAVARALKCDPAYISKIETGQRLPSPDFAGRLEHVLGLKRGTLVNRLMIHEYGPNTKAVVTTENHTPAQDPFYQSLAVLGISPDDVIHLKPAQLDLLRTTMEAMVQQLTAQNTSQRERAAAVSAKQVLILDDEVALANTIADTLRARGMEVLVQTDSARALQRLLHGQVHPQVLLLDMKMPPPDGIEVLRKLRMLKKPIKVIVMTAHHNYLAELYAQGLAIEGYFEKPVSMKALIHKVEELLQ